MSLKLKYAIFLIKYMMYAGQTDKHEQANIMHDDMTHKRVS